MKIGLDGRGQDSWVSDVFIELTGNDSKVSLTPFCGPPKKQDLALQLERLAFIPWAMTPLKKEATSLNNYQKFPDESDINEIAYCDQNLNT